MVFCRFLCQASRLFPSSEWKIYNCERTEFTIAIFKRKDCERTEFTIRMGRYYAIPDCKISYSALLDSLSNNSARAYSRRTCLV